MKRIEIKKGQILQKDGDLNTKVYHVESGLLRSYTIDESGKEHIFMFAPEKWLIGDGVGHKEPCQLFIDALEDSIVIPIERDSPKLSDSHKLIRRVEVLQNRINNRIAWDVLKHQGKVYFADAEQMHDFGQIVLKARY